MAEAAKPTVGTSRRDEPSHPAARHVFEEHPLDGRDGAEREDLVLVRFDELPEHGTENSRRVLVVGDAS